MPSTIYNLRSLFNITGPMEAIPYENWGNNNLQASVTFSNPYPTSIVRVKVSSTITVRDDFAIATGLFVNASNIVNRKCCGKILNEENIEHNISAGTILLSNVQPSQAITIGIFNNWGVAWDILGNIEVEVTDVQSSSSESSSSSLSSYGYSESSDTSGSSSSSTLEYSSSSSSAPFENIRNFAILQGHGDLLPFTYLGQRGYESNAVSNSILQFQIIPSTSPDLDYEMLITRNNDLLNTNTTSTSITYVPNKEETLYCHDKNVSVDLITFDEHGVRAISVRSDPNRYNIENVENSFYIPKFTWS